LGFKDGSHIVIRTSVFTGTGICDRDCAHGIYIGWVASLHVFSSVFLQQHIRHHIKSRALRTELAGNTINDGPIGNASNLVDVPDGGSLIMRNNVPEKGPASANRTAAISIGEESKRNTTGELVFERNTFPNDFAGTTAFVRNQTFTLARLLGNTQACSVTPLTGPGTVSRQRRRHPATEQRTIAAGTAHRAGPFCRRIRARDEVRGLRQKCASITE